MLKRFGNVTVATAGFNVGIYHQSTPYRSTFLGVDWQHCVRFGQSNTPGVRAFAVGPVVVGRYNLQDMLSGKAVR